MHNAIGQKSVMKGWGEFKEIFWSLKKLTTLVHECGGGGGGRAI